MDADKVQASDKTQKSRAVLGRSVNGVVTDHIQVFLIAIFWQLSLCVFGGIFGTVS